MIVSIRREFIQLFFFGNAAFSRRPGERLKRSCAEIGISFSDAVLPHGLKRLRFAARKAAVRDGQMNIAMLGKTGQAIVTAFGGIYQNCVSSAIRMRTLFNLRIIRVGRALTPSQR